MVSLSGGLTYIVNKEAYSTVSNYVNATLYNISKYVIISIIFVNYFIKIECIEKLQTITLRRHIVYG